MRLPCNCAWFERPICHREVLDLVQTPTQAQTGLHSEFRVNLKAKKYVGKEQVESTAFDSDEGNNGKEGRA